jgi:hypothetical protein
MGGSSWSDDFYRDREELRKKTGAKAFAYDHHVKTDPTAKRVVHDKLNPRGVTRESRDSDAHPSSVAIGVVFDVTGSMGSIPTVLQQKLPQLMGLLLRKGYVEDPQVLFGAVGDYFADRAPLQIGQFESGIEMDDDLGRLLLEGGGGGSFEESYQDALYFFARHTSIDCFEKRGKKGYLFLIGDEMPYRKATAAEIAKLIGDDLRADVPVEQIVAEAREKYHVFFVIPRGASHGTDPKLFDRWASLLGPQNVIMLDEPSGVCEAIGLAIGLVEGTADDATMAGDLASTGADPSTIAAVSAALDPLVKATKLAKVAGTSAHLAGKAARSTAIERL